MASNFHPFEKIDGNRYDLVLGRNFKQATGIENFNGDPSFSQNEVQVRDKNGILELYNDW